MQGRLLTRRLTVFLGFTIMFVSSFRRIANDQFRRSSLKLLPPRSAASSLVRTFQKPTVSFFRRNMLFRLGALAALASSSTVAAAAGKQQAPIVEYFRSDYKPSDYNVGEV